MTSQENRPPQYISEEKALTKIQELLDAGAWSLYAIRGLAGLGSDKAFEMRRNTLENAAFGETGVNSREAVAESLAGIDSENAWEMREELLKKGVGKSVARSLSCLDSERAWAMREELILMGEVNSVAKGLAGLDSVRAWEMRRAFLRSANLHGSLKGSICLGLAGLDSESAWEMRRSLLDDHAKEFYMNDVAISLVNIDSGRAWEIRKEILEKARVFWGNFNPGSYGPDGDPIVDALASLYSSIARGLAGLDSKNAWDLRAWLLRESETRCWSDVAEGLAGLDSDRAWQMREEILNAKVDEHVSTFVKGSVALGISGDWTSFIWQLQKDKIKAKETGAGIENTFSGDDYPRTYVVYDLETTGLDPTRDEAVEIGVLLVKEGEEPIPKKWLLKPSIPVPVEASKIHGITQDEVERFGRDPIECWREFAKFTGIDQPIPSYPFVGHNIVSYDNIITNRAIRDIGLSLTNVKSIDTAAIYKGLKMGVPRGKEESHGAYANRILGIRVPGLKYKLEMVYSELGGLTDDVKAHRAEGDVKMTNFIYRKMTKVD